MKLPLELFKLSILKSFTKVIFASLGIVLGMQQVLGQINDNFSDGDFLTNPAWQGTESNFFINTNGQLQLNAPTAGTAFLSSPFSVASIQKYEWRVYVKQNFSPSGNNYSRVYLTSDQGDLTTVLNGYYLQFGEAGSTDAIELFRQDGNTSISICRASNSKIASSFALRMQVLRDEAGGWQLLVDYSGGYDFTLEASGTDATYTSASFLGVQCTYTASNATNFFFDDFYAGPQQMDTIPPVVQHVEVLSSHELNVVFDEKVDQASVESESNYSVSNGVNVPSSAVLQFDEKTVTLSFVEIFPNGKECGLTVSAVTDKWGNVMAPTEKTFLFFEPVVAAFRDVVITEIMADPTPTIGLPEAEFLEIFNRSDNPVDLTDWRLTDGSSTTMFPFATLLPGEYKIVSASTSANSFASFGNVLGVSNFPTLNNTGDNLVLKNEEGITIDSVAYSHAWYGDQDKKEGGWSLELIDVQNVCAHESNWSVAEDERGGTPGQQNSVFANKPDLTGPRLLEAIPVSADTLQLRYDEKLDALPPLMDNIIIEPKHEILRVDFSDLTRKKLNVVLKENLISGTTYMVSTQDVYDCAGNLIQPAYLNMSFGLPEEAEEGDVVINEILFNPRSTGVDFIEIYNASSKYLNLKSWQLGNIENDVVTNIKPVSTIDLLLAPHAYRVFTTNNNVLKGEYVQAKEETFIEINLPSLNDDAGSVVLLDQKGKRVDYLHYTRDMHSPFINNEEGVSLERVSAYQPTNDLQNWKSASSTVGYATPGYVNSNAVNATMTESTVTMEPEIFEPINGTPNFTIIKYLFDQGGLVANIKVLDPQGRLIKQIANNEVLATTGFFRWDGDRDDGTKARVGYYMIWFEIFDANGLLKTFRKRVVVASKFH